MYLENRFHSPTLTSHYNWPPPSSNLLIYNCPAPPVNPQLVLTDQARPLNISTTFKRRAMLIDKIWHAAGDESTDAERYTKHFVHGMTYTSTEVYMVTDTSPEFKNTWEFLDGRITDAFDLKKDCSYGQSADTCHMDTNDRKLYVEFDKSQIPRVGGKLLLWPNQRMISRGRFTGNLTNLMESYRYYNTPNTYKTPPKFTHAQYVHGQSTWLHARFGS